MAQNTSKTATGNAASKRQSTSRKVYLVDGARTPFLKAKGRPGPFSPVDLAVQCGRPLLLRQPIPADAYDQVILGCVNVVPSEMNPARVAGLNAASSPRDYARQLAGFSPKEFKPEISLVKGLTDPIAGLSMGQTAEVLAQQFNITRQQADEYAVSSHQRLARAQQEGWLDDEVVPAVSPDGKLFRQDDGVRADTSADALAKLKAAFEPPYGQVTPGNSSQVTDGASWLVLASEDAVKKYGLEPRALLVDSEWAALDPKIMGLGPVLSATALLKRHNAGLNDIDLWEINEAFAAQVLACTRAWDDAEFCRVALGLDRPMGKLDPERLNIDGGAVAMGHPVGTSGNRIVLHLMNALQRKGVKRGIATECIGGGQSGAMLLEAV